jgi:DNA invertase Pin-like site-specific DNA recombinase
MSTTLNCAIYTRKSSDEGLEQEFNSLDAQRESCESYALSQKGEGWKALKNRYDDGGYSGGNTERPGLQRLLEDIRSHRIHIVIVYKVDRLTRSLSDFARMIELFDAHGVSFVSVTQQFNTTTSMGRLTLNVLLSFAQFEREVTGERIRDKIAASKKKGMWMGGCPPMGYHPHERSLKVDEPNAERVRELFRLYLASGSIPELKREVDQRGWLTPKRVSRRNNEVGGRRFSRGHLRLILESPVYRGQIVHKGAIYQGQHPPIIDEELWLAVQALLAKTLKSHQTREGAVAPCLLSGLLFDHEGRKFSASGGHIRSKKALYRFYICALSTSAAEGKSPEKFRLPANEIEGVVIDALVSLLTDSSRMTELISSPDEKVVQQHLNRATALAQQLSEGRAPEKIDALQSLLDRVSVHPDYVEISVKSFLQKSSATADATNRSSATVIKVPVKLRQRSKALRLVVQPKQDASSQEADPKLGALISKAHDWLSRLTSGRYDGVQAIATEEKMTSSYVTRIIYVAYLAPDISLRVLKGDHPPDLTAKKLLSLVPLPDRWEEQRRLLGMQI